MPTVSVGRDKLFAAIGKTYTEEEFDELCFEFGIELDDVTTEKEIKRKEANIIEQETGDEEVLYKIDIPANRYDLLCLEGLARALRVFLGVEKVPCFRIVPPASGNVETLTVTPETALIRPFIVGAILRNVTFDQTRYDSFIDLQDRLHQNLCRQRTLVAIGTHDLDTIKGPFTYEALPPDEISFVPLKQSQEVRGEDFMDFYEADNKLRKFLHTIRDSPVYPVVLDGQRTVLSLPPIINGAHSAIRLSTKNVLIECTATDLTKANIVLNTVVTMFSQYCADPFAVEPMDIIYPDGTTRRTPDLSVRTMEVNVDNINKNIGVSIEPAKLASLLNRMQLEAQLLPAGGHSKGGSQLLLVSIPPTRSDILHPCDVVEDVAIAYGFNNIPKTIPATVTVGRQNDLNHFSDLLRQEIALVGFMEVLTFVLCSKEENGPMVNASDERMSKTVIISNPKSFEFQVVRSSLLPGMLKTVGHNKDSPLPIKLFEVSDVALMDDEKDVGAKNVRKICALHCNLTTGFEVIHGLMDRIMEMLNITWHIPDPKSEGTKRHSAGVYCIVPSTDGMFFSGRQANILVNGKVVGVFGVVHPEVLERFDIPNPCSALEMDLEPFLALS